MSQQGARAVGPPGEVLKMREELLALYRKSLGSEHNDTLRAAGNLASSYGDVGRLDEALKLQEETLAICQRVLGPEHLDTLWTKRNLTLYYATSGRGEEALKIRQDLLPIYRKVLGPQHHTTQGVTALLADSYVDAGRVEEAMSLLAESSKYPFADTMQVLINSVLQAWFGRDADHAATCRRTLEHAADTDDPSTADRAAKAYCLLPSSDPRLLETALTLARRAVEHGKNQRLLAWYQMTLGMAEYRHANYAAAGETLSAAIGADKDNEMVRRTAGFFQAMSRFRQGEAVTARQLFDNAAAQMKVLPVDDRRLARTTEVNDVILWLAFKEAKALLQSKAEADPAKSGER